MNKPTLRNRIIYTVVFVAGLFLSGCAVNQWGSWGQLGNSQVGETESLMSLAQEKQRPAQGIFEVLLAEFALHQKNIPLASDLYAKVAESSGYTEVYRRAISIALYEKNQKRLLDLSKQWVRTHSDDLQARRNLVNVLVGSQTSEGLAEQILQLLKMDVEQSTPDSLLSLNSLLTRFENKKIVVNLVEQVCAPYQKMPEAHAALAQAYLNAKNNAEALASVNQALLLNPDWEKGALLKIAILASTDSAPAIDFANGFLESYPDQKQVRMRLAILYAKEKQYDQSRQQFDTLLEKTPDDPSTLYSLANLMLQQRDFSEAKKVLRRLLTLNPPNKNSVYYLLGQIEEEKKNSEAALVEYGNIKPGLRYLSARLKMAQIHSDAGNLPKARSVLRQSLIRNQSERLQIILAESQLLRDAKQYQEAFDLLDARLKNDPDNTDLLYESALLVEHLGRTDEMELRLHRLLELQPSNPNALNALGYSFADRNVYLEKAYNLIFEANTLKPNDPYIIDSLGWVLYRQGKLEKALKTLKQALKIKYDPEIAAHLGEVMWKAGDQEAAQRLWKEAAQQNPKNETLVDTMNRFLK